jgi:hypothetical protein
VPSAQITHQMAADMLHETGQALLFAAFMNAFLTAQLLNHPKPLLFAMEQAHKIFIGKYSSIARADLTK